MVLGHAARDRLEQHRLARLGRRDDQAALPAAQGSDQIDQAARELRGIVDLEPEQLVGEDGREILEERTLACFLRILAVDQIDAQQAVVLLALFGRAHAAGDVVPHPQRKLAHLGLRDIHVRGRRQHGLPAQEAITVVDGIQDPSRQEFAVALGIGLQQPVHQLLLLQAAGAFDAQLLRGLDQLISGLCFKFGDVQDGGPCTARCRGRARHKVRTGA